MAHTQSTVCLLSSRNMTTTLPSLPVDLLTRIGVMLALPKTVAMISCANKDLSEKCTEARTILAARRIQDFWRWHRIGRRTSQLVSCFRREARLTDSAFILGMG